MKIVITTTVVMRVFYFCKLITYTELEKDYGILLGLFKCLYSKLLQFSENSVLVETQQQFISFSESENWIISISVLLDLLTANNQQQQLPTADTTAQQQTKPPSNKQNRNFLSWIVAHTQSMCEHVVKLRKEIASLKSMVCIAKGLTQEICE